MTDIRDPKIDEMPPPYECSSCSYTTWSWNEAKKHNCAGQQKKETGKASWPIRASVSVLYASITASLLKPLVQLLEKASDGSIGDFRESSITLPSEPGRPVTIFVRRGAKDKDQADNTYSVSLEITRDE